MSSKWTYSRGGTDYGPVSSVELAELAKNGQLLPTDLLWRDGMSEWKPAGSFSKLFPPRADSAMPVIVVKDSQKAKGVGGGTANKTMANKVTSTLRSQAQTAIRLAVLSAEKTKTVTVSLPLAYAALGKYIFETRTAEDAYADVFKELDAIASAIAENARPIPKPKKSSLTEKAKELASQGMQLANSQKLLLQQKALFAKLGRQGYSQKGAQAGPERLVQAIKPLVERLATLEKELSDNVHKAGGKKRLWAIAGGVFLVLLLVGVLVGDKEKKSASGSRSKNSPAISGSTTRGGGKFKAAVAQLTKAGFQMEPGVRLGNRHLGSAIGVKSTGEDDLLVCVGEFAPLTGQELELGEPLHEAIVARRELQILVGGMLSVISRMPDELGQQLLYVGGVKNDANLKHTKNGTTSFVGIMLIGGEQCEVTWAQEYRNHPAIKIWKVEYDGDVVMMGTDDPGESRPSRTKRIQRLLTGGEL